MFRRSGAAEDVIGGFFDEIDTNADKVASLQEKVPSSHPNPNPHSNIYIYYMLADKANTSPHSTPCRNL